MVNANEMIAKFKSFENGEGHFHQNKARVPRIGKADSSYFFKYACFTHSNFNSHNKYLMTDACTSRSYNTNSEFVIVIIDFKIETTLLLILSASLNP